MSFEVSISESGKYVRAVAAEPLTRELAQQIAKAATAAFNTADPAPNGFLFDFRAAPNIEPPSRNYQFAYQDAERLKVKRGVRTAIVVAIGDRSHDMAEAALRNAGYLTLIFTDERLAIQWLESDERLSQDPGKDLSRQPPFD